ncbi:MAG TPA: CRISPR-associated protein Cas4 [Methylophilaceae bacterium]|jgi:CRISPR-associated exonuclease Cas4
MAAKPDDPLMISALQHWSYCPRQCALIHMEQAYDENVHTMRGNAVHKRVDIPGFETFEGVRSERALPVWSDSLGLVGKCDVVEFHPDGRIYPVEYKHGRRRIREHDDLQLAAQAMCLEEMLGRPVPRGTIYHHSSRRRREVMISAELRQMVRDAVDTIRVMLASGRLPPPANDERCRECSLIDICQPKMMAPGGLLLEMRQSLFDPEE